VVGWLHTGDEVVGAVVRGIGVLGGVQHPEIGASEPLKRGNHPFLVVLDEAAIGIANASGGGDDHDFGVEPTRLVDEGFENPAAGVRASTLDVDALLKRIGQSAEQMFLCEASAIMLLDEDQEHLFFKVRIQFLDYYNTINYTINSFQKR